MKATMLIVVFLAVVPAVLCRPMSQDEAELSMPSMGQMINLMSFLLGPIEPAHAEDVITSARLNTSTDPRPDAMATTTTSSAEEIAETERELTTSPTTTTSVSSMADPSSGCGSDSLYRTIRRAIEDIEEVGERLGLPNNEFTAPLIESAFTYILQEATTIFKTVMLGERVTPVEVVVPEDDDVTTMTAETTTTPPPEPESEAAMSRSGEEAGSGEEQEQTSNRVVDIHAHIPATFRDEPDSQSWPWTWFA